MDFAIVLNSPKLNRVIEEEKIITADAGYIHVQEQNKKIYMAIGDFDSAKVPENTPIIKLNPEKDDTDGEAALNFAITQGAKSIAIYGITGGRLDHELCNLGMLVHGEQAGISMIGRDDNLDIYYKEFGIHKFKVGKGTTFSTIAFGQAALLTEGDGVKYPINNLQIEPDTLGIGISNVAENDEISFKVVSGGVLVFIYR